jgi:phosphopantothenoylcysteine decarboxylase/phosphopantothenate--cysteine ligase
MMGCEIANAFYEQGANVLLVKGPCNYRQKEEIQSIEVKSAKDMLFSVEDNIEGCDIFVSVAAVSDFTVKDLSENKIKSDKDFKLELTKNIDILKTISKKYNNIFTIGFAAETSELKYNAVKKLKDKKISVIAANKVSFSEGIDNKSNSITLYWGDGLEKILKLKDKRDLAIEFVEEISNIYN